MKHYIEIQRLRTQDVVVDDTHLIHLQNLMH